jgi:hypothetical protein
MKRTKQNRAELEPPAKSLDAREWDHQKRLAAIVEKSSMNRCRQLNRLCKVFAPPRRGLNKALKKPA